MMNEKLPISAKKRARKMALQALYQWQISNHDLAEIEAQFRATHNMEKIDQRYFCHLLYEIPKKLSSLDDALKPFIQRPLEDLTPVELIVLRMGAFELLYCLDVPYRVVLDEAISLDKAFGAQEGHRFINGVLHGLAKKARQFEMTNPS